MRDALPPHLARYADIVGDVDAFADALARPLPQTLFTNSSRLTPERMADLLTPALSLTPLAWRPGGFRLAVDDRPGRHWSFTSGLYSVQEEASLLPVAMLDVQSGQRALDLCAAPGNKTAQIALALGNRGTLIANDLKTQRLSPLHDLMRRMGIVNVSTTGHDGSVYPVADHQFDRILVDAPCTAEGKARRGYVRDSPPNFRRWVVGQQRALLKRACMLLRGGGRLVYSTCTFAPEENECLVDEVLRDMDGRIRILPPDVELPGASPGLTEWAGVRLHPGLKHARRLWPHLTDTGGFFAVTLERTDTASADADASATELPPIGAVAGLDAQCSRFGVPSGPQQGLHCFEDERHLRVIAADHHPPRGITLENMGIDVARRRARETKLSTAGAMALASGATRNLLDLEADAFAAWRRRQTLELDATAAAGLTRGAVLIRHQGLIHGTAFLRLDSEGCGLLESQYPKAWMLGDLAVDVDIQ